MKQVFENYSIQIKLVTIGAILSAVVAATYNYVDRQKEVDSRLDRCEEKIEEIIKPLDRMSENISKMNETLQAITIVLKMSQIDIPEDIFTQ